MAEPAKPPTHDTIATRARVIAKRRGGVRGEELADWLQAERAAPRVRARRGPGLAIDEAVARSLLQAETGA